MAKLLECEDKHCKEKRKHYHCSECGAIFLDIGELLP
jgi:hypothetical protein